MARPKALLTEELDGFEVTLSDDGEPPTEIQLFAAGTNATSKGDFVFDAESARDVMLAFASHGADRLPFDSHHLMLTSDNPEAKKALGWFVPKVSAEGALLASDIQWTPKTAQALKDREYRFHSPAIAFDAKTRRIRRLVNVALTNLPATKNQTPLMLSEAEPEGNPMKLFEMLSASDEGSALIALTALQDELKEAKVQLATLTADIVKSKRDAEIEKLSACGKLAPTMRAFAETLSLEQLTAFGEALPVKSERIEEPRESHSVLSDDEKHAAKLAGVSEADYLAQKIEIEKRNAARKEG
jgi:phage I-like protein